MYKNTSLSTSFQYELNKLILYFSDGNFIDLSPIKISLDLFENIFSPVMSGQLVISDGNDIFSTFKIHGNEYLEIEIDKPTLGYPIKKVFRVYKAVRKLNSGIQTYTLHFCSEELMLSSTMKISKSYRGMTSTQIISDILLNIMKTNPNKVFQFDETGNAYDVIIPMMTPFQAINWILSRAYSHNESIFFFYETRDGFTLKSYENLIKNQIYKKYFLNVKVNYEPYENENLFTHLQIDEDFDLLRAAKYGTFSSKFLYLDLISKKLTTNRHSAFENKNRGILNKELTMNSSKNRLNYDMYTSFDNMIKYSIGNDSDITRNPLSNDQWLPQTTSKMGQLQSFKMTGTVPGDPLLKAGAIVYVTIPKLNPQEQLNIDINKLRTGKYLVTSVHHLFNDDVHTTVMEMVSDSVNDYMNSPSETQKLRELKKA